MKPAYFLSISSSCWSAFSRILISGSELMQIKYGTHCKQHAHVHYKAIHWQRHPATAQWWRASWCLTSLSSTNIWLYQRTKGQAWRAIPTQYRKASDILTSTLAAAFLFSSHPKRKRDRKALNYYTSTDNRERQPSHNKTKINLTTT